MRRRLFVARDQVLIDAFAGVSERRRHLSIIAIAAISVLACGLMATGQIKTFGDGIAFRTMMLFPTFLIVWFFWIWVIGKHRAVFSALWVRPQISPRALLLFIAASFAFSLIVRGKTTVWWGAIDPLAVIIGPLGEEFLYRFALLYSLASLSNRPTALVVSAVLFGAAHAITLPAFLVSVAIGFLLGALVMRYGSLLLSVLFHIIFNATAYLV